MMSVLLLALAQAVAAAATTTPAGVVTVHNNSGCCCGNIYPRSAANLVGSVSECTSNCAKDPLCHAAIMITGAGTPDPAGSVREQCQLTAAPPPGKACCIHKPHFDGLGSAPVGGLTVIDMGTSPGSGGCPCKNNGYDKPCDAPVPKTCLMYKAPGANPSGVFGPCSGSVPPGPPPPSYEEAHRPIYHLTPASGHNNDPNGMFYDPVHGMYHVFVQYKTQVVGGTGPEYWYHFASPGADRPPRPPSSPPPPLCAAKKWGARFFFFFVCSPDTGPSRVHVEWSRGHWPTSIVRTERHFGLLCAND